jgi:hypothetical protein
VASGLEAQPASAAGPSLVTRLDPPSAPAVASAPAAPVSIVAEVEKMVQAGTDADVIKAFIQSWKSQYPVTADEILRLHDVGTPTDVLTTLIQRSAQIQAQATPSPAPSPNAPRVDQANPPAGSYPQMAVTNPPAYIYPYPSTPSYTYSYLYPDASYPLLPNYYSDPYWSPFSFSYYYSWPGYRYGYRGYRPYGYGRPSYWYSRPGIYGHGGSYGYGGFNGHSGFRGGAGGFGHGRR